jgi:hypothetical protein
VLAFGWLRPKLEHEPTPPPPIDHDIGDGDLQGASAREAS